MRKLVGVDIGGTKCAVVLAEVDKGIHILDREQFDTLVEQGREQTLQHLYQGIAALMERHGLAKQDVAAIGISCGGPLDSARGRILSPPNLPGWNDVPIVDLLSARFGVPAYLQNDANACALVEWKLGAGQGVQDMVFLTMGTGMGAGIISGGRLLCGAQDLAGEVGHLRLAEAGPLGYGKEGSFEGFASGGGIARWAGLWAADCAAAGHPVGWGEGPYNAKELAGLARRGDADARRFWDAVGERLGQGIAVLADVLNPACVVIGSIFVRCEDLLRPAMERVLSREALPGTAEGLRILPAQTGESLGDLAGVMVALYALDIDPMQEDVLQRPEVQRHLMALLTAHPELAGIRVDLCRCFETLVRCYQRGGKLLLAGNGGSCSDAQHIAGELMKGFYLRRPLPPAERAAIGKATAASSPDAGNLLQAALPAIVLSDHSALSTAFANDVDPQLVYAQQVVGYGKPGDVFLGLSTSGNARNVLLAAQVAKASGLTTLALTGGDGGQLAEAVHTAIVVPGNTPASVQELHLPVYHALCAMLESAYWEE